ncbi:MAG: type IV conjugative transfer system lipoprotein TraV [Burkholderiales bacterium]
MNKNALLIFLAALTPTLVGCSSLTGIGGSDKLACKAPDGVTCSSLSGVYANALANNLPGLQKKHAATTETTAGAGKNARLPHSTSITGEAPTSGEPILTKAHVMRIWVAPWEDSEGDLHDQSYIYVVANSGRWAIEHNEKQIMNRYQPTFLKQPAQGFAQPEPVEKKTNAISNNTLMLSNAQGFQSGNSAKTPGQ